MNNLQNVFDVAESLSEKGDKQEIVDNTNSAADLFVNRKDLKSTRKVFGSPDVLMTMRTIDEEEHE
eukprot:8995989-Lingulodinium_polyedra.AAC.1